MKRRRAVMMTAALPLFIVGGSVRAASSGLPAYFEPSLPPNSAHAGCPSLPALPSGAPPPMIVRQFQPPKPTDDCTTYQYGPITVASGINTSLLTESTWSGGLWPSVWVNRALRPSRIKYGPIAPNPINPAVYDPTKAHNFIGIEFSTVGKANAVTTATTLRMLGAPTIVWEAPLIAAGFVVDPRGGPSADVISYTAFAARPSKYFNFDKPPNSADKKYYVFIDKMVMQDTPGWTFSQQGGVVPTGVMVDYEVDDFRPIPTATFFLTSLALAIHSQPFKGSGGTTVFPKAYLYTNPWHGPWDGGAGGDSFDFYHIDEIKTQFDYISLYPLDLSYNCSLASSNGVTSAYDKAISFLGGVSGIIDYSKIILTFDFSRCSSHDAIEAHSIRDRDLFLGYELFDGGESTGGQSRPLGGSNLQIWNLLYGKSNTPPAP